MELLSDQGLRIDGRRPNELRRINCKLGVSTQPDGSSYLEQGNTKVLAAVYGPHQVRGRSKGLHDSVLINCQYSMATFSINERKRRPRGDQKSIEMNAHLKQVLQACIKTELYPMSQIDVFVEVLQADGGHFCCCVNAATLALIDAGIPIHEYMIGCAVSLADGKIPLMDTNVLEESLGGCNLTLACMPLSGQIALLEMSQKFHIDYLPKVLDLALEGCREIYHILDNAVKTHIQEVGPFT